MPILWVFETDVSHVFCIKRKVDKISSCLLKPFFLKQVKYSAREGEKEREGGGEERKEKEKVKTAVSLLSPKTISKFCFLRMPEFGKVIFCIWIRILRRSTISKRFVRTFKLSIARQRLGNCATSFKALRFLAKFPGVYCSVSCTVCYLFLWRRFKFKPRWHEKVGLCFEQFFLMKHLSGTASRYFSP